MNINNIYPYFKGVIYITFLLYMLLFSTHSSVNANTQKWDFNDMSKYSFSDTDSFYQANSSVKLKPKLSHTAHLENGPSALDWWVNVYTEWNYAYVASYMSHAITVVDISDPKNMKSVWYIWANWSIRLYWVYDLVKKWDYLFAVSYSADSLEIIDVSDPIKPKHVTRVTNTSAVKLNGARGLQIKWDYAFITSYIDDSVQIIDISNPLSPTPVSYVQDTVKLNWAMDLKVSWDYMYVSSYLNDSIAIIDISNIQSPAVVWELTNWSWWLELDWSWWLEIDGNELYIIWHISDSFHSFDISDNLNPILLDSVVNWSWVDLNGAKEFRIMWNEAYIASSNGDALQVLDISNPKNIKPITTFETDSFGKLDAITGISILWDHVFVTSYTNSTLHSIYINTPSKPIFHWEVTSWEMRLWTNTSVMIEKEFAYVSAYWSSSVEIIDISDESIPVHKWSISDHHTNNELRWAWTTQKKWNYLFVWSYTDHGIEVLDVSDPSKPKHVSKIEDSTTVELHGVRWLDIVDNFLYVASYHSDSLQIIDISDPENPKPLWNIKDSVYMNGAIDVEVQDEIAYVIGYSRDNISSIDVSDPENPRYIAELRNDSTIELNWPYMVQLNWEYAYISAYVDDWIQVINISDPGNMKPLGMYKNDSLVRLNGPRNFTYDEWLLYLWVYSDDSVQIIDVSDPYKPEDVSYLRHTDFLDTASATAKNKQTIYATTYYWSSFEVLTERYDSTIPYLTLDSPYRYIWEVTNFSNSLWSFHEWSVRYQLSNNWGTTRYYHNWIDWIQTTAWYSQSNSISELQSSVSTFNDISWSTSSFNFKAFYYSDWHDKVELDSFSISTLEIISPIVSGTNIWSWSVLPWATQSIIFNYSDETWWSGIDTNSWIVTLQKWDGNTWWSDISSSIFWTWTFSQTQATYSTTNFSGWKYKSTFNISDTAWNTSETYEHIFYIDIPEFIVSEDIIALWTINLSTPTFAPTLNLTVKTIWVPYKVYMNKEVALMYSPHTLPFYDGTYGIWYDKNWDGTLVQMWIDEVVASWSLNIGSNFSSIVHTVDIGWIHNLSQAAWTYTWEISFRIEYDY